MKAHYSSNAELYYYLKHLHDILEQRNERGLAKLVDDVCYLIVGNSTEFLGESRIVLRLIQDAENNSLNLEEKQILADTILILDDIFKQ